MPSSSTVDLVAGAERYAVVWGWGYGKYKIFHQIYCVTYNTVKHGGHGRGCRDKIGRVHSMAISIWLLSIWLPPGITSHALEFLGGPCCPCLLEFLHKKGPLNNGAFVLSRGLFSRMCRRRMCVFTVYIMSTRALLSVHLDTTSGEVVFDYFLRDATCEFGACSCRCCDKCSGV